MSAVPETCTRRGWRVPLPGVSARLPPRASPAASGSAPSPTWTAPWRSWRTSCGRTCSESPLAFSTFSRCRSRAWLCLSCGALCFAVLGLPGLRVPAGWARGGPGLCFLQGGAAVWAPSQGCQCRGSDGCCFLSHPSLAMLVPCPWWLAKAWFRRGRSPCTSLSAPVPWFSVSQCLSHYRTAGPGVHCPCEQAPRTEGTLTGPPSSSFCLPFPPWSPKGPSPAFPAAPGRGLSLGLGGAFHLPGSARRCRPALRFLWGNLGSSSARPPVRGAAPL